MNSDTRTMRAWRNHEYGSPTDVMRLDEVPIPQPNAGELLVKVHAIPLNLNDYERVSGGNMFVRPELPAIPGMEVMGAVESAGEGAENWIGKRVVAITSGANGGYAEYATCPTASAFEVPESIPLPDAAAIYFPFHLAWLGMLERAKLKENETVLINGAAGSVGTAAIQLAVNVGARVIAISGSDEKAALCKSLGAEVSINHTKEDFVAATREWTNNKGVDIVFDSVGESVLEQNLGLIAYDGRYVMMGFASDKTVADEKFYVPRRLACSNISLCAMMLFYADEPSAAMAKEHMGWNFVPSAVGESINKQVIDLVAAGKLHAVIGRTAAFEALPAELSAIVNRETLGRTVITFN